ncbi:MAG: KEOPS complex subunit Pcc1 [Candidatus Thalassarchaeaceae archaeon]|jgi:hypothetical protein|nr:hypothetical protein [Euryarchaeota archaeon]MDP6221028.1 KEOPS complex subunit Pcc1 [Candidatus Thalassarchaeaceae archaeon]MBV43968.1 hypothetical protein [Euryarchaeota archaeon]MDP7091234.1 KEOPS complex subunit Pcc1 [Candidatus Thalassarchaeaceae archaeon]MDP7445724.1 KEOPS complex subunit Pcc1 [Candidatus Thalassarchaeaceae archaeon]|tara:strand:- start:2120 stop:2359 length:240 start_codon:yes stop_codon:yes gene_type:complete
MGVAEAEIIWTGDRARAEALMASIIPDDPSEFEASLSEGEEGVELRIVVRSGSLSRTRLTVDDILACLAAVESGLDAVD